MSDNPFLPPDDLTEALEGKHTDELVDLLRLFKSTAQAWGAVAAIVEAEIATRTPTGVHATSEGKPFTVRKGSTKTTYDHPRLWARVVAVAADERQIDKATGEVLESEGACVARVLRSCLGSNLPWIVSGLKALNLDPDDFREQEGYRATVQLD